MPSPFEGIAELESVLAQIVAAEAAVEARLVAIESRLVALEGAPVAGLPQSVLDNVADIKLFKDILDTGSAISDNEILTRAFEIGRRIELFAVGDNKPVLTPTILVGLVDTAIFTHGPAPAGTNFADRLFGFWDVYRQLVTGVVDIPALEPKVAELVTLVESIVGEKFRFGHQMILSAVVENRLSVLRAEITALI